MNKTIWKQANSRWGSKPYPTKSCTMSGAGCGCVAVTHIAMEQDRYKNWTPENLRPWMVSKGFAVAGQGTKWEGITETLKHLGHSNVVRIYSDPMSEAWKELNKGNRIGVILFVKFNKRGKVIPARGPDGTLWTTGGHYVAFTDYKVQNGKHYFYCKDSGGRNHDGWFTYENSMKGCISKMWIVERINAIKNTVGTSVTATAYRPTTEYRGSLPKKSVKKGSKGSDVKAVQTFLNWCINAKLKVDGSCGKKTVAAIKIFQKTYGLKVDGHFGPKCRAKANEIIKAHKPVPKPTPAPSTSKVLAKAIELSWPKGTKSSTYAYPDGKPTSAFKKAFNAVFPEHTKWGKGPRDGASCDVAAATCVRASGVEPNMPRGYSEQIKYTPKHMQKLVFTNVAPYSVAKPGDMVDYTKNASGSERHVIIMGENCFYEAQFQKTYLHCNTDLDKVKTKRPKVVIFREVR